MPPEDETVTLDTGEEEEQREGPPRWVIIAAIAGVILVVLLLSKRGQTVDESGMLAEEYNQRLKEQAEYLQGKFAEAQQPPESITSTQPEISIPEPVVGYPIQQQTPWVSGFPGEVMLGSLFGETIPIQETYTPIVSPLVVAPSVPVSAPAIMLRTAEEAEARSKPPPIRHTPEAQKVLTKVFRTTQEKRATPSRKPAVTPSRGAKPKPTPAIRKPPPKTPVKRAPRQPTVTKPKPSPRRR